MSRTPPAHAAVSIYSEGDFIYLQLRATKGYTQELSFPATAGGMAALLRVLREREMASVTTRHAIAGPTMPIQFVVDAWTHDPDIAAKAERARRRAERERFASKPAKEQMAEIAELFANPDFDF